MKRLFCLMLLLLPLTGCALCEDIAAFSEREWHKYTDDTSSRCGSDPILPAQTTEPPR